MRFCSAWGKWKTNLRQMPDGKLLYRNWICVSGTANEAGYSNEAVHSRLSPGETADKAGCREAGVMLSQRIIAHLHDIPERCR